MFAVLRILFVLAVVLAGWSVFCYLRTHDRYWLVFLRRVIVATLALLLLFFVGLVAERFFWL
ncbi:hypothetical protein [Jeongeupia naejangsanensis]|uniref:DUF2909 domain-containing protein n=1 Tax=Jeongeupia naejangsanensis TaxID=613195 RepID=A0ABS2BP06_9NEIS|nr:hypothetical protein [Jeongeupia naejangsanensis]MBM3116524.1 hypothetical protein [Jeongeupia naejangsanensis]